ncbi:MAG TPA: PQQ-binding-like beta-propeller repeat protein, partial [Polyangiaceae bacterium]|nr:PQQ-binding-like beta-propeller repeat protein [Polyangiaceae bacterium]
MRPALCLLSSIALATPAASAALRADAPPPSICDTELPLGVKFRFHAGAPSTAPVRARSGAFYVGTIDGQVHALHPDGSFYWNYTVTGAVTGRLLVERSGLVLVPATQSIYALNPDGTLAWRARTPVEVEGGLVRDARGGVHFAGADGRIFELGERGKLVTEVEAEAPWSALPTALPDGSIAAGSASGLVVVSAPSGVRRFE